MARCGCNPKCNCSMANGVCTTVEGQGSAAKPYKVNITVDGQTVFCGPNGLNAKLTTLDTNTVDLNGDGTVANPLEAHVIRTPDGNVPDPDALGTGNLIKELPGVGGGIYVSCEDIQDCIGAAIDIVAADCLEYNDATNTIGIKICIEPNGVECAPAGSPGCPLGGLLVIPSSDPNNSLTFGTDGNLFAPAAAVLPGDCMSATGTGTQADPFILSPQIAPELNGVECVPGQGLLVAPSSDANNHLGFGGDQRLFTNRCPVTVAGSQVLIGNNGPCFEVAGGTDCATPLQAILRISDDPCNGLACGNDGLYVQLDTTELPATAQQTFNFGPLGPFNGTTGQPGNQVAGPFCITITNPSPCRAMITTGFLDGFAEIGRTSGEFRAKFEISTTGNPGGPWFTVSQVGTGAPEPANRYTGNALWGGDEFTTGPGGSRSICFRLVQFSSNANNGRIFAGQATLAIVGKWAQ